MAGVGFVRSATSGDSARIAGDSRYSASMHAGLMSTATTRAPVAPREPRVLPGVGAEVEHTSAARAAASDCATNASFARTPSSS